MNPPVGTLHEWALKHRGAKYKAAFAETAIEDREGLLDIMIADRQTHATIFGGVRPKTSLSRAIAAARMYAKLQIQAIVNPMRPFGLCLRSLDSKKASTLASKSPG